MCGIFGALGLLSSPSVDLLPLFTEAGKRGPNAWGIAWEEQNDISLYRQQGQLKQNDAKKCVFTLLQASHAFIGQTRLATSGNYKDEQNNQPLLFGNGDERFALSHNGNVYNSPDLIKKYHLTPQTECDSEVLGLLILQGKGTLIARTADALSLIRSSFPIALLVLGKDVLIAARYEQPLYIQEQDQNIITFCSRKTHATDVLITDQFLFSWSLETGKCIGIMGI